MAIVGNISGLIQSTTPTRETQLVHTHEFSGVIINDSVNAINKSGLDFGVPYAIVVPVVDPDEIFDGIHAVAVWDILDKSLFNTHMSTT